MIKVSFKNWLENQTLGGGLEPPKELPDNGQATDGNLGAFKDSNLPGSDQVPPVNKKMKKKQK